MINTVKKKLAELGMELPAPLSASPLADHIMVIRSGDLLLVSGVGPIVNGRPEITGRLVRDMKHEDGYRAASIAALNLISLIFSELRENECFEILKLTGFVAGDDDFYDQHMILNGASHLINELFGENGRHICTAVGVNSLPFNVPVVIDAVVRIKTGRS